MGVKSPALLVIQTVAGFMIEKLRGRNRGVTYPFLPGIGGGFWDGLTFLEVKTPGKGFGADPRL